MLFHQLQQEWIPVGCVLPTCNSTAGGVIQTETPWTGSAPPGQGPSERNLPWTETPWTETLWTETPCERIVDRCKNITFP